jgi:hypothetical protein
MRGWSVVAGLLATLIVGCGSSSSSSTSSGASSSAAQTGTATGSSGGSTTVSLSITGGTGNLNAVACGKQEPFEHFTAPAQVHYSGTVSPAPSGRWKVKIKLKVCNGTTFVDSASQKIVGQPSGAFDGIFPVLKPGSYSLRAELESAGKPESPKLYLQLS